MKNNNNASFFYSVEGIIFLIGCAFLIVDIILYTLLGASIPEFKEGFLPMIVTDLLSGRLAGISIGLELGLTRFLVVLISVTFKLAYLFVLYPLIIYFYEHLIELKLIGKVISSTKETAEKHLSKIERWGLPGIALFVWIPLFSTGSLVGAIIGRLSGMRTILVICVVVLAMASSAIS